MYDIATIGHILYDVRCYVDDFPLPDRSSLTKGRIKYSAGGSACNSVVCASNLGKKVTICGRIGFDDYGIFLINNFIEKSVDTSDITIDYHNPTGISVVTINRDGQPEIVEMLGANEPMPVKDIKADFFNTKLIHMTGTNPSVLMYVSTIAKERGIKVMFDPGRSTSLSGYKKLDTVLGNSEVIISNKIEILHLLEMDEEKDGIVEIFKKADALYPDKIFIIKQGGKETIVKCDKSFKINTFKVDVVDTLGAGDSFAGAFATAWVEGKNMEDCVTYANAAAALKVTKEGAQSSPQRDELERFLEDRKNDIKVTYF